MVPYLGNHKRYIVNEIGAKLHLEVLINMEWRNFKYILVSDIFDHPRPWIFTNRQTNSGIYPFHWRKIKISVLCAEVAVHIKYPLT